jgi:hypothetical protein
MPGIIVFIGPSLAIADARDVLDADYRPPVAQGDVLRALDAKPDAIGIIDGFFENVPSVWHKEILFAMTQGVRVFGSASMGALRAAELHAFGMEGVGAIFEAYKDGRLEDDDEVAVTHGPAEIGFPILTEAMVNIRRTLSDAFAAGVLDEGARRGLEDIAKGLNYKERTYARILRLGREAGLSVYRLDNFLAWLPDGRADQKREDALAMLRRMRREADQGWTKAAPLFPFEHTTPFAAAVRGLGTVGG